MPIRRVVKKSNAGSSSNIGEYIRPAARPGAYQAVFPGTKGGIPVYLKSSGPAGSGFLTGALTTPSIDDPSAISLLSRDAFERFKNICDILQIPDSSKDSRLYNPEVALLTMQDAHARFKAWGESIAAFHNGTTPTSLDFRLKEAPEVRGRAFQILKYLQEYLHEVTLIIAGIKPNGPLSGEMSDSSDESGDEETDHSQNVVNNQGLKSEQDEGSETSELDELMNAIVASNKSLMKLSMVIRNSPARDDYNKAASRYKDWNPYADIGHVREKYGSAKGSTDWLLNRFGSAIARRRQFLKYRIEHAEKMAGGWEDDEKPQKEGDKPEKTIASTKATTFLGNDTVYQKAESDTAVSFGSQTSYEQTVAGDETAVTKLVVPNPPKFAFPDVSFEYGEPFNCPYCYTVQNVKNKAAWKKHVFRDLKPYVCTFRECSMMMFRSRNEWFAHELQNHRRKWVCPCCQHAPFLTSASFSTHVSSSHPAVLSNTQIEAVTLQSEEAVENISAFACPLCDEWQETVSARQRNQEEKARVLSGGETMEPYGTKKQFRRHLGRHMEQLALFALPKNDVNMDDDSTQGDDEEQDSDPELPRDSIEDEMQSPFGPEGEFGWQSINSGVKESRIGLITVESRINRAQEFVDANTNYPAHDKLPRRPTLQEVLTNTAPPPWTLSAFTAYLSQNHCLEILEFTVEADRYTKKYQEMVGGDSKIPISSQMPTFSSLRNLWKKLLDNYITPNAPREMNLPSNIRDHLLSLPYTDLPPDPMALEPAVKIIYELMDESVLVPFLNSVAPAREPETASTQAGSRMDRVVEGWPTRDNSHRIPDKMEWFWFCHKCGDGPMSAEIVSACLQFNCNHWRCADCRMELHKAGSAP